MTIRLVLHMYKKDPGDIRNPNRKHLIYLEKLKPEKRQITKKLPQKLRHTALPALTTDCYGWESNAAKTNYNINKNMANTWAPKAKSN